MSKHPEFLKGELQALNWSKDLIKIGETTCWNMLENPDFATQEVRETVIVFAALFNAYQLKIDAVKKQLMEESRLT